MCSRHSDADAPGKPNRAATIFSSASGESVVVVTRSFAAAIVAKAARAPRPTPPRSSTRLATTAVVTAMSGCVVLSSDSYCRTRYVRLHRKSYDYLLLLVTTRVLVRLIQWQKSSEQTSES